MIIQKLPINLELDYKKAELDNKGYYDLKYNKYVK